MVNFAYLDASTNTFSNRFCCPLSAIIDFNPLRKISTCNTLNLRNIFFEISIHFCFKFFIYTFVIFST